MTNSSSEIIVHDRTPSEVCTSEFLLPFHFVEHVVDALEEGSHFGSLVVALRRVEHPHLRIPSQIFANLRYGEDDLLHRPIVTNYLLTESLKNQLLKPNGRVSHQYPTHFKSRINPVFGMLPIKHSRHHYIHVIRQFKDNFEALKVLIESQKAQRDQISWIKKLSKRDISARDSKRPSVWIQI